MPGSSANAVVYYWIDLDNDERNAWTDTYDIEHGYSDEMWVMMIHKPVGKKVSDWHHVSFQPSGASVKYCVSHSATAS